MKHLLSIEQLSRDEIERILQRTAELKTNRGKISAQPLAGQTWALIFSKPSTRTRVSFEVGIRELGGETIYLNAADAQLGRGELIKDTARVLARMIHGAVIRTYAQSDIEEFAEFSGVPTINALTDEEHPCQILGDIFTIIEKRGQIDQPSRGYGLAGKTVVTYIGDGVSNTARSWLFAAGKLDFELRIASHKKYLPKKKVLERAGGRVTCTDDVPEAAKRRRCSLHRYLGFDGQRSRGSASRSRARAVLDQRIRGQAGQARRVGDALSTGAPGPGNR